MDEYSVRRLAARWGWTEVQHNVESRVMGFVRGVERVNVYYTTGTVGTCVDHPRAGKTQLFRRNQTLATLGNIFQDPRVHTGAGYYRRHSDARPEPSQDRGGDGHIWVCLGSKPLQAALLDAWDETCTVLALGDGYFTVDCHGSTEWWGVPIELHNKVNGRQKSLPPVDYVVLGEGDDYFVQFADGSCQWSAYYPSVWEVLQSREGTPVELLAFAPGGGYYIMWEDGESCWLGLPRGLHNQLIGRQKSRAGVEFLAVGPGGEWFVRFLDGGWRADDITDGCSETLDELHTQGWSILKVLFGHDGSWAIIYS